MPAKTTQWRCLPHGHTWSKESKTSSPLCPHCGTNACEKVKRTGRKYTPANALILLAAEINHAVVSYAWQKTLSTTAGRTALRNKAISRCQQLVVLLQADEEGKAP